MIYSDALYLLWAPAESPWSPWVKPVLFAQWSAEELPVRDVEAAEIEWTPPADGRTALVCDLPGGYGVAVSTALAVRWGYRPILLYNALPGPRSSTGRAATAVDVRYIQA